MMYSLGIQREFSARHYLTGGDWGEENIEHTHHYRLELILEKPTLDQHGFLVDIVEVESQLDKVVAEFSSKTLNSLASFAGSNPSIERLATILNTIFQERFTAFQLSAITVIIHEDAIAWTSCRVAL